MPYLASESRYEKMTYNRTGNSGLKLPQISLGWWYNFGGRDLLENGRAIARRAFDLGVTHFDLANNYGPPPGSAESNFGRILATDLRRHRDEIIGSSKAGYYMHPGPYGGCGSRKYLFSTLQQGLLTDRYLGGIPDDSRVRTSIFLNESDLNNQNMPRIHALNDIAK